MLWRMKRPLHSRVIGRLKERSDERAPRLTLQDADGSGFGETPIFIIGAQRSGTSLLRRILDSHSRITCPPESKFILPLAQVLNDRKSLAGWESMGFDRGEVERAMGKFIRSFFDTYTSAQGKARWAEKTPNYVDCLPELWDMFGPSVQFIYILRHGLDVANSLADPHRHYPAIDEFMEQAGGNAPVAAGLFWADKNRKILKFQEAHPEAGYVIRYEELTTAPEVALKPMFEFLNEPWEPEVIDYDRFPHHAGFGDPDVKRRKTVEPNSGKYKSWPEETQRQVRQACGEMLQTLGYE